MARKKSSFEGGRQDRYIQPSILLSLLSGPSYGYEIIRNIQGFGFVEGSAPPGMIYRHLRQMEEEGLVRSEWETAGQGPARRVYAINPEGEEMLSLWMDYLGRKARALQGFVKSYKRMEREKEKKD
ncbi:MAG TPA: helix-turn-helix transcriptional regulator [Syntrophales bacterium]|nr:helix-turn-helix transcriptional regulator [Syntrophales bacterium]